MERRAVWNVWYLPTLLGNRRDLIILRIAFVSMDGNAFLTHAPIVIQTSTSLGVVTQERLVLGFFFLDHTLNVSSGRLNTLCFNRLNPAAENDSGFSHCDCATGYRHDTISS
ncbi:hypothetical protein EVAR_30807_1 [Eumeta japonica]|uniref:Uncharacterized protein n=1 Tax=Eumeta variegata TaxID=151549 RepID=A0A4C1V625_EUMVA|nr:hypothetical protein EVAR_30807_1 [Eumeta japonica]